MHNAPAVDFPVGRFVWGPWVLRGLAIGSALSLGWWQSSAGFQVPSLSVWAGWLFLCILAMRVWRREHLCEGVLVWTGDDWFWRDAQDVAHPVRIAVVVDAGFALLVNVSVTDGPFGLARRVAWLERTAMPALWHDFRCAVFARPKQKVPGSIMAAERP